MNPDTNVMIAFIVTIVAILIIAAIVISVMRKRRRERLRENFGPEYDRTVALHGNTTRAESVLADREKRVHNFSIRHLSAADRDTFAVEWDAVQRRFVDDPAIAVTEADSLVNRVMTARGYPLTDFEQRSADLSVNYPNVVHNYRLARDISLRHANGQASTEDLRQAMVYYRSLFAELLEAPKDEQAVVYQRAS
jgi:hypothetical protein